MNRVLGERISLSKNMFLLHNKKCIPNCNMMLLHVNDENKWWGLCLHFRFHMIIINQYDGEVSNLALFFSPLLIAVVFLQQRRLLINPQWGSPYSLDNMYLSSRQKVIVAPFLSQSFIKWKIFQIYLSKNKCTNKYKCNWTKMCRAQHYNTLPDYKTLAHVMTSSSICMHGHEQSCTNKGHKSTETKN